MATGYREFDDFPPSNTRQSSNPLIMRNLQEVEENVQHFVKNVKILENKTNLLNTKQDSPHLRDEIIQLVTDTAQLAKITNSSVQKLRLQSNQFSPTERNQFETLMTSFSSAGIKYKNIQRLTQNMERQLIQQARQRSSSTYSDTSSVTGGSNPFDDSNDTKQLTPRNESQSPQRITQAQMDIESADLEERERHMRQLETEILDINDIFRDLGTMVHDQGEMIDNIEANVEIAATRVESGNRQLGKAVSHKRCSRKLTLVILCVLLTVAVVIVIVILILLGVLGVFNHNN